MGDHRKLKVWQEARGLAKSVYLITRSFSPDEKFGLRFVGISRGSGSELNSHLTLASDLGMADSAQLSAIQSDLSKIHGMLACLAKRLSDGLSDS